LRYSRNLVDRASRELVVTGQHHLSLAVEHGPIVPCDVADGPVMVAKGPQAEVGQEVARAGRRELAALLRPRDVIAIAERQREVCARNDVVAARSVTGRAEERRSRATSEGVGQRRGREARSRESAGTVRGNCSRDCSYLLR